MKYLTLGLFAVSTIIASCQNTSNQTSNISDADSGSTIGLIDSGKAQVVDVGDNSRNAVDWEGEYEGTLPCADCEGIKTVLIINQNETFSKNMEYLGREPAKFTEEGTFTWDNSGGIITLKLKDGVEKYRVGEGRIWMLDQEGNLNTGSLADHYILTKK